MRRGGYAGGHLGEYLEEYVDGSLNERDMRRAARHLVCCSSCREDVGAERAIIARLRQVSLDPSRQADLIAGLLAVAPPAVPTQPAPAAGRPAIATLQPSAPPQYSRRRRTPVVAAVALSLGCLGIVTLAHAPHRTAPGQTPVAGTARSGVLTDEVTSLQVHAVSYGTTRSTRPSLASHTMSGTIGP